MRHYPRRSTTVTLTLLSGIATAVLAACRSGSTQSRHCVDQQDRVVTDSLCAGQPQQEQQRTRGSGVGAAALWFPYRYYYGGSGYAGLGSRLSGGSYTPSARSRASSSRSATARGGFGRTGGSRGGFGG